ncbi:MAG TPA: hypothetical protein VMZ66_04855 [Aeromicrobium sp.]|nr:hypothetical protein [Aeromicrobium sp.]
MKPIPRATLFRVLGLTVAAALTLVLAIDLFFTRSTSHLVRERSEKGSVAYTAVLSLRHLGYDLESRAVKADVTLEAQSLEQGLDPAKNMDIWLSVLRNDDGSVERVAPCTLREEWTHEHQYAPKVQCDGVALPVREVRRDTFYPFDVYGINLHLRACIAEDLTDGCIGPAQNVDFTQLRVEVADPTAVVDAAETPAGFELTVRRKFFIRGVSLLFGSVAVLFLSFVANVNKPDDLFKGSLGFFGALWALRSLIVPASIKVFPTIIDYGILTLFCLLFAAVLLGLSRVTPNQQERTS